MGAPGAHRDGTHLILCFFAKLVRSRQGTGASPVEVNGIGLVADCSKLTVGKEDVIVVIGTSWARLFYNTLTPSPWTHGLGKLESAQQTLTKRARTSPRCHLLQPLMIVVVFGRRLARRNSFRRHCRPSRDPNKAVHEEALESARF